VQTDSGKTIWAEAAAAAQIRKMTGFIRAVVVVYAAGVALYSWSARVAILYGFPVAFWVWWSVISGNTTKRRQDFRDCTLCCMLPLYLCMFLIYAWSASLSSPSPWVFRLAESPVGRSSCSHTPEQDAVPYHPLGWLQWSEDVAETLKDDTGRFVAQTFCALPAGSRWAGGNMSYPQGYRKSPNTGLIDLTAPCEIADPTCESLASDLPEDYPNLGWGLRRGLRADSTTADIAPCEGVAAQASRTTARYQGLEICSQCMLRFPAHCKVYEAQLFCFVCPGGYIVHERAVLPTEAKSVAILTLGFLILILLATVYAFPPWTSIRPQTGYNIIF
jgi:hypothetical protein